MSASPLALGEPHIVLKWLARLRWLAALGQIAAVVVAVLVLHLSLNLVPILSIICITIVSNLLLEFLVRFGRVSSWVTAATVVLDVLLLTGLLYYCGGPDNPFCVLYVIHIVMAVVALGPLLKWVIVAQSGLCYAAIVTTHIPLALANTLNTHVLALGQWAALSLVAILIAYFVGRITLALRQREAELATFRERSARSEMLASLTTLAAGAAHELGTPLATIAIAARELELALQPDPALSAWADDARLIRSEVDRCRNILERMRVDVSDELRLRPAQISISDFLSRLKDDLAPTEWAKVRVTGNSGEIVRLPSRAMRQALNVLLRNALEVTPDNAVVNLRVLRSGNHITFEVHDHGPGMEPDVARRAGEPFFTTKPVGQGMGMGLFLVRMVAEQTKGSFQLHSAPGAGTRSVLSLPIPDAPARTNADSRR